MGSGIWHKNANGKAKTLMGNGKMNNCTNGHGKWETVFQGMGNSLYREWETGIRLYWTWEIGIISFKDNRYQNFLRLASLLRLLSKFL